MLPHLWFLFRVGTHSGYEEVQTAQAVGQQYCCPIKNVDSIDLKCVYIVHFATLEISIPLFHQNICFPRMVARLATIPFASICCPIWGDLCLPRYVWLGRMQRLFFFADMLAWLMGNYDLVPCYKSVPDARYFLGDCMWQSALIDELLRGWKILIIIILRSISIRLIVVTHHTRFNNDWFKVKMAELKCVN